MPVLPPLQRTGVIDIVNVAETFTVTVTVCVSVHPLTAVPVTVYVVVIVGQALTLAPVVALSAVAGDHVYVFAPLAVNVAQFPEQIVAGGTVTVGFGLIDTVIVAVDVQPAALVPVIVYVVVAVGQALTVAPVVALNAVAGDQV